MVYMNMLTFSSSKNLLNSRLAHFQANQTFEYEKFQRLGFQQLSHEIQPLAP